MQNTQLHKPSVAIALLTALYALSFVVLKVPFLSAIAGGVAVTLLFTVPFLVPLVFLGSSERFLGYLDPIWVKTSLVLVGAAYAAMSNSWASSVLNNVFSVGAGNFPLTQAVLTVAYFPLVVFKPIFSLGYIGLILGAPILWVLLTMFSSTFGNWIKRTFFVVVIFAYFGTLLASFMFWERNSEMVAGRLALSLDFDKKHLCTNLVGEQIDSVVSVGEGNVVIHRKVSISEVGRSKEFEIRKCVVEAET